MTGSERAVSPGLGKRRLIAWAVMLFTFFVCVFLPEVVSAGWHLTHGNSASFQEWKVPVPWGWRSFTGDDTLIVQRMHRLYFRPKAFSQIMVGALSLPANAPYDYEKQKRSLIDHASREGYQFRGEHRVRIEAKDGYCIAFTTIQNAQRLWITCDIPDLHLSVSFIGNQSYAPALDSIIERIRRAD
jgi:hypothetical protein